MQYPPLLDSPAEMGLIHLTGVGGIGMSALAQILQARGYAVQGSDLAESALLQTLRDKGIPSFVGHDAAHLTQVKLVVLSSAISSQNPEVSAARKRQIPIIQRADMLGALMHGKHTVAISGTHGKTTTTSLIAALLDMAQFDPTVMNGGIMNRYASNVRIGQGDWMVVEADESDGTLVKLPTTIGVLTNIDPEHMEFYKTADSLEQTFLQFITQLPSQGLGILCVDNPRVRALAEKLKEASHSTPLITYGFESHAQLRAENIHFTSQGMMFDALLPDGQRWEALEMSLYGEHNVLNALSCIAVAMHLKIPEDVVRLTFSSLTGVKRRFTRTGTTRGVTVIDDYAHHPVEIRAVLKTAKKICRGRVIAVCQPHRYTRLSTLFEDFKTCFHDADDLVLVPIYAAGEAPLGISSIDLGQAVHGVSGTVECLNALDDVAPYLHRRVRQDDMVICLGAGSITQLAHRLPTDLEEALSPAP